MIGFNVKSARAGKVQRLLLGFEMSWRRSDDGVCVQWSSKSRVRWATTATLHFLSYCLVILTAPISLFFVLRRIKVDCKLRTDWALLLLAVQCAVHCRSMSGLWYLGPLSHPPPSAAPASYSSSPSWRRSSEWTPGPRWRTTSHIGTQIFIWKLLF